MKTIALMLGAVLISTLSAPAAFPGESPSHCPNSAREFITTLEFLRQEKELSLPEKDARELALKVAQGCEGAADRFIRVSRVLKTAGMGGADTAKTGLAFARQSEAEAKAFIVVFQETFAEEGLDLDLDTSVRMARSLSADYDGDLVNARKDFRALVAFCLGEKTLNFPKPRCGDFALGLARKGTTWAQGVSAEFISSYEFLKADPGPAMTSDQALKTAELLITTGPGASENFRQGFKYASAERGLGMPRNEALTFAQGLTVASSAPAAESAAAAQKAGKSGKESKPSPVSVLQRKIGSVSKPEGKK